MRIIFSIWAILVSLFSFSAMASQNSQLNPIGYSTEGRFFAYEEYRVNEASGKAYAKIYVIDLLELSRVVRTPIIYRADIGEESISDIRKQARKAANPLLQSLTIERPAIIAAMIGDGQPGMESDRLKFAVPGTRSLAGAQMDTLSSYEISLDIFKIEASAQCDQFMDSTPFTSPVGFSLSLRSLSPEVSSSREIYRDEVLQISRGCPFAYEIAAIIFPYDAKDLSNGVAVISANVASQEGILRHYLAISLNK